jgi:hypothetical protein
MHRRESGQALIEWALLLMLFVQLTIALYAFAEWFVIRQEMISVVKEGARLYSSGRVESPEVKQLMQRAFRRGRPSLTVSLADLYVGSSGDSQEGFMKLDKVSVRYAPKQILLRHFTHTMEESCVIKHAPQYGYAGTPAGYGPPVPWEKT